MPPIQGFKFQSERTDHFDRHVRQRKEFSFATEEEYEAAAIDFMSRAKDADTEENVRARDGTIIRFNKSTKEICFLHADDHIGSYYKVKSKTKSYEYFLRKCELNP